MSNRTPCYSTVTQPCGLCSIPELLNCFKLLVSNNNCWCLLVFLQAGQVRYPRMAAAATSDTYTQSSDSQPQQQQQQQSMVLPAQQQGQQEHGVGSKRGRLLIKQRPAQQQRLQHVPGSLQEVSATLGKTLLTPADIVLPLTSMCINQAASILHSSTP